MNPQQLHDLIDQVIQDQGALRISYRNNEGRLADRVVQPLAWQNFHVFTAFCTTRQEQRSFKLSNILHFQTFDSLASALSAQNQRASSPPPLNPTPRFQPVWHPPAPPPSVKLPTPFLQVTDTDSWSRLLNYYIDCLARENQQQYQLRRELVHHFPIPPASIHKFLNGSSALDWAQDNSALSAFIQKHRQKPNTQLCLGYPFLALGEDQIFPLIYAPLSVTPASDRLLLQAQGAEVSYAAFKALGLPDDEILALLAECQELEPAAGLSPIATLISFVLARVDQLTQSTLSLTSTPFAYPSIYNGAALFWVTGNNITGNLIQELNSLSSCSWKEVPSALRGLLSLLPDHPYPQPPGEAADPSIYATAVNARQAHAIHAARTEPLLIVTGPPGTGKSQLVLNLITQAFLKGEKVLFASRNNRAVDVVMSRLQHELNFPAAVRAGSAENRQLASRQMLAALDALSTDSPLPPIPPLEVRYQQERRTRLALQSQLEQLRHLTGLRTSYQAERQTYLDFLPPDLRSLANQYIPTFQASTHERLQSTFSTFLDQALALKEWQEKLERDLLIFQQSSPSKFPLLEALERYEAQWGTFGAGFLHVTRFDSPGSLQSHLQTWLDLLTALSSLASREEATSRLSDLNARLADLRASLPAALAARLEIPVFQPSPEYLSRLAARALKFTRWFSTLASPPAFGLPRLLHTLRYQRRFSRKVLDWLALAHELQLPFDLSLQQADPAEILQSARHLQNFLSALALQPALTVARQQLTAVTTRLDSALQKLPPAISADLNRLPDFNFDQHDHQIWLNRQLAALAKLTADSHVLANRLTHLFTSSPEGSPLLAQFFQILPPEHHASFQLPPAPDPRLLVQHLSNWRILLTIWRSDAGLRQVLSQLDALPAEALLLTQLRELSVDLAALSAEIYRAHWLARAARAGNQILQSVRDYATALEGLSLFDPQRYRAFKSIEDKNFPHVLSLFPVWGITNLTARSNLPLTREIFDLVILDEASQCDLPSALPLLYRARRIVIIGDPNQLRHVATLRREIDLDLAHQYGVEPGAFLYGAQSLFDVASRAAGAQPGSLLLNEHYRSDARIISFSNHEFYQDRLIIKTDLALEGIPPSYLNNNGGLFWLDVPGTTSRANNSNTNQPELEAIQQIVPHLATSLAGAGLASTSIGIVTPYREQEQRLQSWLKSSNFSDSQVIAGTAHKFQGGERDFMIFSPVAAPGMTEGSLNWLEKGSSLLNVAVTRARLALIIVGDWHFCRSLPASHRLRHLAEYAQSQARVITDLDALPFWHPPASASIIGQVTDPHNPEHNRTTLRRYLTTCRDFIWWVDPYLNDRTAELFWDVFLSSEIALRQVRLLTAFEQTQARKDPKKPNRPPDLNPKKFTDLRTELLKRGIEFDLRFLPSRELPHDRLLYTPTQAINMPPFSSAFADHTRISEYTQSHTTRDLFESYWRKAN